MSRGHGRSAKIPKIKKRSMFDENVSPAAPSAGPCVLSTVCRLIEVLPRADWLLQSEIETWLSQSSAIAQEAVAREITRRQAVPRELQAKDNVLRLLLAVKGRIDEALGDPATSRIV